MSNNTHHFEELELVAEKAGELNDRVGKIESELGAQTKTLESAALVLDAAIKGLGALKSSVLENDIGALQLALNDKTAHLSREIARFETAVAEIDRRAEAGDEQLAASLRDTALGLRESFNAKNAELAEWSARVEREIAAHSVALAAIPPVIKGADAKPFNPRGEWQAGMIVNSLDVVSYNGSSYISNEDGNTEKPTRSAKYTTLAKRSGNGAGGATDFAGITGSITPAQIVPGEATFAVGDVLYAGTTGTLSKLGAGTSGQLLSTQGAGAAPIWVSATGGAGDMNGPASATDNAIVRFDGTGGKTVQNSAITIADTTGNLVSPGAAQFAGSVNAGGAGTGSRLGQALNSVSVGNFGGAQFSTWTNAASNAPALDFSKSRGATEGTYTTVQSGDSLGYIVFRGADGTAFRDAGYILGEVDGTPGASDMPGRLIFSTSADGSPNPTERLRIASTGIVSISNTLPATTSTSAALAVAGGIYAGAASVFGGQIAAVRTTDAASYLEGFSLQTGAGPGSFYPGIKWRDTTLGDLARQYAYREGGGFGTSMVFQTSVNGSATPTTALRLDSNQSAIFSGAATFAGAVTIAGTVIHTLSATPASASAAGTVGTMSWDANYIYICTATNTWKRVAIATW